MTKRYTFSGPKLWAEFHAERLTLEQGTSSNFIAKPYALRDGTICRPDGDYQDGDVLTWGVFECPHSWCRSKYGFRWLPAPVWTVWHETANGRDGEAIYDSAEDAEIAFEELKRSPRVTRVEIILHETTVERWECERAPEWRACFNPLRSNWGRS